MRRGGRHTLVGLLELGLDGEVRHCEGGVATGLPSGHKEVLRIREARNRAAQDSGSRETVEEGIEQEAIGYQEVRKKEDGGWKESRGTGDEDGALCRGLARAEEGEAAGVGRDGVWERARRGTVAPGGDWWEKGGMAGMSEVRGWLFDALRSQFSSYLSAETRPPASPLWASGKSSC